MADALAQELEQCLALHQEGSLSAAEECYRRLLDHFASEADLLHLFGLLRAQQGFLDEGTAHLRSAVALAPDAPIYRFNLATVYLESGNNAAAVAEFIRCRELSPAYAGVSLGLGRAQAALGHYGLAVESLEEAVIEQPDDPVPPMLLGDLHLRHNFFAKAIAPFEHVRRLAGDTPEILALLAKASEAAGDLDRALEVYGAIAAADHDPTVADHVSHLETLRRARDEARKLTDELDVLSAAIEQGKQPPQAAMLAVLGRSDTAQRIEANRRLARACLSRPERSWREQARGFAEQAWLSSEFADELLPQYLESLKALGDIAGIRAAYDRAGIEAAKRNDVTMALRHFETGWTTDHPG